MVVVKPIRLEMHGGRYYVATPDGGLRIATETEIQRGHLACDCWACRDLTDRRKARTAERAT